VCDLVDLVFLFLDGREQLRPILNPSLFVDDVRFVGSHHPLQFHLTETNESHPGCKITGFPIVRQLIIRTIGRRPIIDPAEKIESISYFRG
jgi:hypothetical protein